MANALKDGLVGYYPLQSNAVNMVNGVAGTINGTPSWVKNHAGKVVLDDTTAYVTHASHATNTVTYWKDGKFYAVLNGVPYMIDEVMSSSFTSCVDATMIGCNKLPEHLWYPSAENLYFDGTGYILLDTGTAAVKHNLIGYNGAGAEASRTTITVEGGTTVPAISYNNSRFFQGYYGFDNLQNGDYVEALLTFPSGASTVKGAFGCKPITNNSGWLISSYTVSNNRYTIWIGNNLTPSGIPSVNAVWMGFFVQSSNSVRCKFSTNSIVTNTYTMRTTSYPMTIGGDSENSGGVVDRPSDKPVGPVGIYKGLSPANYTTFLSKRLARVQAGTWQPYIPMEDLV